MSSRPGPSPQPPPTAVREAVGRALTEDLTPLGDLTSSILDDDHAVTARFVSRHDGVLAGTACATEAFAQVDPTVVVSWTSHDGDRVTRGGEFGRVVGPLRSVLTAERTALNFLGHLSGIATLTSEFVLAAARSGGRARVWDTRKTTPGLRSLEKAAVRAGGGRNHRGNLSDWILLKDNHLVALGITSAVAIARDLWPGRTVQVECDRLEQMMEAAEAGADAVLLDNMSVDQVRACVEWIDGFAEGRRRCLVEVSGGVDLASIADYSAAGVDMISVGRITNSAPVLDIGLDIEPVQGWSHGA